MIAAVMGGRVHKISIALLVGGVVVALILVLLGVVLTVNYRSSRSEAIDLLGRVAQASSDLLESTVREHLDDAGNQAVALALHLSDPAVARQDAQYMSALLDGAFSGVPQVFALTIVIDGLVAQTAMRESDAELLGVQSSFRDYVADLSRRAAAAQTPFWTEISYAPRLRRAYIGHVAPILHDGAPAGFVVAYVTLADLSEFITTVGLRFRTNAYLLLDDRKVIAHPLLQSTHPDLGPGNPLVDVSRLGDPVLAVRAAARSITDIDDKTGPETTISRGALGRHGYIFLERTIGGYGEKPWIAGVYLDSQILEGHLRELQRTALIGAGVALIGIIVALFIGRAIARPIQAMSQGAARVAELDLSHVERLPRSFLRELDAQAASFNRMLGALRWFEVYVPRTLVSLLVRGGADDVPSVERTVTVMFTDLVGFSGASARLSAAETASLLNRHFTLVAGCVEAESGTIDKFIGDALMAFWNAPDLQPDHAARAVRAALAAARAVTAENDARRAAGLPPLGIRLGLHTGPAVIGNIGAPGRMNYTVVGDTINVGQRLEGLGSILAPKAEAVILISGAVAAAIGPEFRLTALGAHSVKGQSQPVAVFRVEGEAAG